MKSEIQMHMQIDSAAHRWFVFVPSERRQREDCRGSTLLKVRRENTLTYTQDEQRNNFRLFRSRQTLNKSFPLCSASLCQFKHPPPSHPIASLRVSQV